MTVESGPFGGVVAGRYAIEAELARGGMGAVLRVADRSTERVLALKRSLPDEPRAGATGARNAALLEREYRTLVTLKHPAIIRVFDYGVDEHGSFYTMELLDGEDLRARSPLGWQVLCANLRDVASSLALLHSRRLLHRDVSAGNIRLTGEGRAKLIDFGTLMSFGRSDIIAGTPSGVAPEALEGAYLDHRVDLYALGATAYYALTKRHAYPARQLSDAISVWRRGPPAPPSEYVPGIPGDLDALVLSLLSLDRALRPSSAAEVMDRLGAIAGLPPEGDERIAQSYLAGHELIGREHEREKLGSHLERALSGRGGALLVGGGTGHGRSTLLARFESDARVTGAAVLAVNARTHQHGLGVWQALVQRAFEALPERAAAAEPHLAPVLRAAGWSTLARTATNTEQAQKKGEPGLAASPALTAFFLALAEGSPLVLLVDDVHAADNDSITVLTSLVKAVGARALLLVASFDTDDPGAERPALQLLRRASDYARVEPFDLTQMELFVRSIFGDVSSTKRLAAWLQEQTSGNPSLGADLVSHLVKEGRIHYAEGTWVLPRDFPQEDVQVITVSAAHGHLARLRPSARRFAECLSPHRRSVDGILCAALGDGDPELGSAHIEPLLDELVREGVLMGDRTGFVFARPQLRRVLYDGLSDARRRQLHRHAAGKLAERSGGDPERELEIGWHLLLAGDRAGAYDRISLSLLGVVSRPDALVRAVPELRDLNGEYRRIGATEDELMQITASLVVSGYYVDPTVHDEFGDAAAELLQRRSGFAVAARLQPAVGAYPALFAGMSWGFARHVWHTRSFRADQFGAIVLSFVGVCAARSAVGYLRLEPGTHELLLRLLAPARGLHRHNAMRLVHDLIAIALAERNGAFGDAQDGYLDQLARLPFVKLFTEDSRHHYEAGLLCSLGRCELLRGGGGALDCASRVDALGGQHDRVLAQYLRCSHHLFRGETDKADAAHEALDTMAAEYGHRWVPDILEVLDFIPYHLAADVVGLKRVLHLTERVLAMAPAYSTHREVIRAMYEGHRGHPELALEIYDGLGGALAPFNHPAWSFARAHRAECLNVLGRHEEAFAVCEEALGHVAALARTYIVAYQQLERERATALSGMGRTDEAARLLDELIARTDGDSQPLLAGLLHRDAARVARVALAPDAFERHTQAACTHFARTENPTLLAQARRLAEFAPIIKSEARVTPVDGREGFGLLQSVIGAPLDVLAQRALDHIVRLSGPSRAYLYLLQNGAPFVIARHGDEPPPPELESQVARALAGFGEEEAITGSSTIGKTPDDWSARTVVPLIAPRDGVSQPIGAAVVFRCKRPHRLTEHLMQEVAIALRASAVTAVEGRTTTPRTPRSSP